MPRKKTQYNPGDRVRVHGQASHVHAVGEVAEDGEQTYIITYGDGGGGGVVRESSLARDTTPPAPSTGES